MCELGQGKGERKYRLQGEWESMNTRVISSIRVWGVWECEYREREGKGRGKEVCQLGKEKRERKYSLQGEWESMNTCVISSIRTSVTVWIGKGMLSMSHPSNPN